LPAWTPLKRVVEDDGGIATLLAGPLRYAESFFARLQTELLDCYDWPTRDGLRTAIIEVFNNLQRHTHLGNRAP
jgi:hypothetical protein